MNIITVISLGLMTFIIWEFVNFLTNCSWNMQKIKNTAGNMQYTKLGFSSLFKGCSSHQVPCSLIVNRSVIPNFAYCRRWVA
jgi:hypothetical protein